MLPDLNERLYYSIVQFVIKGDKHAYKKHGGNQARIWFLQNGTFKAKSESDVSYMQLSAVLINLHNGNFEGEAYLKNFIVI